MIENHGNLIPSLAEFTAWKPTQTQEFSKGKSVVFATGGTTRWYFLEHGDPRDGYTDPQLFLNYGRHVIQRVVDIASMMFADGISTVFIVGFGGGQGERNAEYLQNMAWAYELLADETTQALYDAEQIGVLFRGKWKALFERLGSPDLTDTYLELENRTTQSRKRRLVWFVNDDLIPESLLPLVKSSLESTGKMPDPSLLCESYYGRAVDKIDIFISNNKLSVAGMIPPLTTLTDLYFTVSPSLFLNPASWRQILYDHVFARRGHYRDYSALQPESMEDMRAFYTVNRDEVQGVGNYHAPSQTWRPEKWSNSPAR